MLIQVLLSFLTVALAEGYTQPVTMEWQAIKGAKIYEIEITRVDSAEPVRNFQRTTPNWAGDLEPGSYSLKVRAFDSQKPPTAWNAPIDFKVGVEPVVPTSPKDHAKIFSDKAETAKVVFEWAPLHGISSYLIEVESENGLTKVAKNFVNPRAEIDLPVAQAYSWKVKPVLDKPFEIKSESLSFTLVGKKLSKPEIIEPEEGFVKSVSWSKPDFAENYDYIIAQWNPEQKKWVTVKKELKATEPVLAFDESWIGGRYKLIVRAGATLRPVSEEAELNFQVVDGQRAPAAVENISSAQTDDRTHGWYLTASYLMTSLGYAGRNWDTPTGGSADVNLPSSLGGTGRVGGGFLDPIESWGWLGIADFSGFMVNSMVHTYSSIELNAIYRTDTREGQELRQLIGIYYRELPELSAGNAGAYVSKKMTGEGLHYGVEYWHTFTSEVGMQLNLHGYYNLATVQSPNGQALKNDISYQAGIMGTYRFTPDFTGLAGFAFRRDSASYDSLNGKVNVMAIQGSYVNFLFEWGL